MSMILMFILVCMTLWILLGMLWLGLEGKVDYFSLRNIFLAGIVVFQLTSALYALGTHNFGVLTINDPNLTGMAYTIILGSFLLLFGLAYRRQKFAAAMARRVPVGFAISGVTSMLTLAVVFVIVGVVMRHGLSSIGLLGILFGILGSGLVSVAAGMAGWVWAPRLFNPFVAMIAGPVALLALGASMHNAFGRRELLGVVFCFGWGMYHGYWKHLGPKRAAMWMAVGAVAAVIPLAAITAVREGNQKIAATEYASKLKGADVAGGMMRLLNGQDAAANSMWLVENYPENFEYRTLATARFFLTNPVPRAWYPNKLEALGRLMVDQARLRQHADNWSLGPGLVGHMVSDNPWLAVPIYAVFFGLFFRFMDEVILIHAGNPFLVLPLGVSLGNVLGLGRGETSLFLFLIVTSTFAAWLGMFICAKILALFGYDFAQGEQLETEWDDDGWDYEYSDYDDSD